jgi:hypothetical protein
MDVSFRSPLNKKPEVHSDEDYRVISNSPYKYVQHLLRGPQLLLLKRLLGHSVGIKYIPGWMGLARQTKEIHLLHHARG